MLGHRKLTVKEYVDILRRRSIIIAACMIAACGISLGVSYFVKPVYESQTMILIQRQQVPEDYVKPIISEDLDARLGSLKEQILSRSRLEPIITRYNLFAGHKRTMDDRVTMMRKAITITQIHPDEGRGGMPGFYLLFDASDARTAQLVCGEITSLFVSANLGAQEQSVHGTTEFLRQQLADSKAALDAQDAKLASFEQKYMGRLPDETAANSNALQALTSQLDATTQSVNQLQQNEAVVQSMLSQQPRSQQGAASPVPYDEQEKELEGLLEQKKQLETIYKPDYPDVIAVSRKITALRAEMKPSRVLPPANTDAPQIESPQVVQLRAQLHGIQQSLATAKQEQKRLQNRIQAYESRIEQSPMIEEEYKKITRDHQSALEFYNSLLAKMNESSMAEALQLRQQGEQFTVMDAPNLPDAPKSPKHTVFAAGGFFAGLVFGLLIAAALEFRDKSISSISDVWEFTNLPTLAVISHVEGLSQGKRLLVQSKKSLSAKPLPVEQECG